MTIRRLAAVGVLLVGVGSSIPVAQASPADDAHRCAPPEALVAWDELTNPVFELPDVAVKDVSLRWDRGEWQLLFSHISDDPFRFRLGSATSVDLADWTAGPVVDQPETGGSASPDISRLPGGDFLVTYNSHTRDTGTSPNKLWFRAAGDLGALGPPQRLAPELFIDADRVIDAALAHTDHGLFLAYKSGEFVQVPMIAHSPSGSIEGPWQPVGPLATVGPAENFQFLLIDGLWHLLVTRIDPLRPNGHVPVLYRLALDPALPASWLVFTEVRELQIPSESWNTAEGEVANAAYLCDARDVDGHWYLLYAGSTEVDAFQGRGHAKVGVARSTDLEHWAVPTASEGTPTDPATASVDPSASPTSASSVVAELPETGERSMLGAGAALILAFGLAVGLRRLRT